ncbi:hypothetical protein SLE2022_227230 [Rubroshorea leprosula]
MCEEVIEFFQNIVLSFVVHTHPIQEILGLKLVGFDFVRTVVMPAAAAVATPIEPIESAAIIGGCCYPFAGSSFDASRGFLCPCVSESGCGLLSDKV